MDILFISFQHWSSYKPYEKEVNAAATFEKKN